MTDWQWGHGCYYWAGDSSDDSPTTVDHAKQHCWYGSDQCDDLAWWKVKSGDTGIDTDTDCINCSNDCADCNDDWE